MQDEIKISIEDNQTNSSTFSPFSNLYETPQPKQNPISDLKQTLHPKEHWKLLKFGKACYLDIETTGLSRNYHEITMIGIYDGTNPEIYINGQNLHQAIERLKEFDIIITFNGKMFDIPFLEHKFQTKIPHIHLDLRYMLKEFGLKGGLKKIEQEIGIARDKEIEDINGFKAVALWKKHKNGDKNALKKLIKYNTEDIINLKTLLQYYIQQKTQNNGL